MDAVEFIEIAQRYTKAEGCDTFEIAKFEPPEEILNRIATWAAEHPSKTRQSELLKLFPNARICSENRAVNFCPFFLEPSLYANCDKAGCTECKRKFWLREIGNG